MNESSPKRDSKSIGRLLASLRSRKSSQRELTQVKDPNGIDDPRENKISRTLPGSNDTFKDASTPSTAGSSTPFPKDTSLEEPNSSRPTKSKSSYEGGRSPSHYLNSSSPEDLVSSSRTRYLQQPSGAKRDALKPGNRKASRRVSFPTTSTVRFSWRVARALVLLKSQPSDTFSVCGVPFSAWPKTKVPTLGASPAGCRVQEMYKVLLPGVGDKGKDIHLFVKVVPIAMWTNQWEAQNKWNGEYTTDGENFVMEAAVLAFLQEYAPGVAPNLIAILELSNTRKPMTKGRGAAEVLRSDKVTHMVIVSELYGEDLLDYLDRRDRRDQPLASEEKRALQLACTLIMQRLHNLGLAHLDFTPENILVGPDGLRLCDFAKATPLWSPNLRHCPITREQPASVLIPFESCEPTVGKGAYMPPECWKVYWKLETNKIIKPLDDLASLRLPEERISYYFKVAAADVYMLGVVIFWIWSEGGIWRTSDPRQDEKYYHLVKSDMNFNLFRECRGWPSLLKECISRALKPDAHHRATINEVFTHPWFAEYIESGDVEGYLRAFTTRDTLENLIGHLDE